MCLGVPMQVVECDAAGLNALCRDGEALVRVDLSLVGPQPPGAWVVVMLGVAREVVDEARARLMRDALSALAQIMEGEAPDVNAFFADLVDREPPLPPHLAAQVGRPSPESRAAAPRDAEETDMGETAEEAATGAQDAAPPASRRV